MKAWNDESNKKEFGIGASVKFALGRMWRGSCCNKLLFFFNILMVFVVKVAQVLNPILLMAVVNSITCTHDCRYTEEETYALILMYTGIKFAYEVLNTLRDLPYQRMAATAEINIADEVYFHVQSLSLAYHLSRETGKVVRIVSRGSQSFIAILRMIFYNLLSIFAEITLTLVISALIFNWTFTALQIFSLLVYFTVTYTVTESRAKGFKAK